jgi:hypothetical protein
MKIHIYLIFLVTCSINAQQKNKEDYVDDNYMRYDNYIYKENIKTVLLYESSFEMNPPTIELNSPQILELSFDDLDQGNKTYQATFFHCDANWSPDDLVLSEYLTGFFDDNVTDRTSSFNTTIGYSHYKYNFPNQYVKFTKSGNYVLLIYENGNRENPVITRRFILYENLVQITGNVHQPLGSDKLYNSHEVDFSVIFKEYNINNPYLYLKITITQNNRWDNAIYGINPMFVKEGQLTFDYDDGTNCFDAGNEFRSLDIKSCRYPGPNTASFFRDSVTKIFNTALKKDEARTFNRYQLMQDINGRMLIKANEATNSNTEADYMWVHFFLSYDVPITDGNLYVMGALTQWKYSKENKMKYDEKRKGYECKLLLKQGYYNYQYLFLRDNENSGDVKMFEGNRAECENDYTIYVYYKGIGNFYDRLIAVKNLNSLRK